MNYIINPIWFYWLNIADGLHIISIITLIIGAVGSFIAAIFYFECLSYGDEDSDFIKAKKILKLFIISAIIGAIGVIFIPDKNVLIEMQIAKFATYENAEWTLETIKSAVDYIVEAAKAIK